MLASTYPSHAPSLVAQSSRRGKSDSSSFASLARRNDKGSWGIGGSLDAALKRRSSTVVPGDRARRLCRVDVLQSRAASDLAQKEKAVEISLNGLY
jgi:hypothetical protein